MLKPSNGVERVGDEATLDLGQNQRLRLWSALVNAVIPYVLYLMLAVPGENGFDSLMAVGGTLFVLCVTYVVAVKSKKVKLAYTAGMVCMAAVLLIWATWRIPDPFYWGFPVLSLVVLYRMSRMLSTTSLSSQNRLSLKIDGAVLCVCLPILWVTETGNVAYPNTLIFLAVTGLILRMYVLWRAERLESATQGMGLGVGIPLLVLAAIAFGLYGKHAIAFGAIAVVYVFLFLLSPFMILLPANYHFVTHRTAQDADPTGGATPGKMVATNHGFTHVVIAVIVLFLVLELGYVIYLLVKRGRKGTPIPAVAAMMGVAVLSSLVMTVLAPVVYRLRAKTRASMDLYHQGEPTHPTGPGQNDSSVISGFTGSHTFLLVTLIVLAVLLVGGAIAYWYWRRKKAPSPDDPTTDASRVRRRWVWSESSGLNLEKTHDPLRLRYQEWLKSHHKKGRTILTHETSRQFEERLRKLGAYTEDATGLRQDYESARYGRLDRESEGDPI
jgi:hypothetical protein